MRKLLPILCVLCLCASCSTTKTVSITDSRHTEIKDATLTIQSDGQEMQIALHIQVVKDSACIISIQPIKGMEVIQLRARVDEIEMIDRMGRRYAHIPYADVSQWVGQTMNYQLIEDNLLSDSLVKHKKSIAMDFEYQGKNMHITLAYNTIVQQSTMRLRPERTDGYSEIAVKDIPQLLGL